MNRLLCFLLAVFLAVPIQSLAVLPQQFSTTRMQGSTSANQIDDKHSEAEAAFADILGLPADTDITAAILTGDGTGLKSINLQAYTVAELALETATAGRLAMISDGDAAGSIVLADGSEFRCVVEYTRGLVPAACTPYNATETDTNAGPEMQAWLDRLEDSKGPGSNVRRLTGVVNGEYTTTQALSYDITGSALQATLRGNGISGIRCNVASVDCLTVTSDVVTNNFHMLDFRMRGGTNRPTSLLRLVSVAQATIRNSNFSDFATYAIHTTLSQHLNITGSILHNNTVAANAGCFIYAANEDSRLSIVSNSFEGRTGSVSYAVCLGGNTIESVVIMGNRHFSDEIAGFVKALQNTTLIAGDISHNKILNINEKAVDLSSNVTSGTIQVNLDSNTFTAVAGATHGIEIASWIDSTAIGNTITGFDFGFRIIGASARWKALGNNIDADTSCFIQGNGSGTYVNTEVGNNSCGSTAGTATSVMLLRATSSGFNRVWGWRYTDSTVRGIAAKWNISGAAMDDATDSLEFAGVQQETCGSSLTLNVYSRQVDLNVTGSPCTITLGEVAINGQLVTIVVTQVSGSTANIADDGSIANLSAAFAGGLGDAITLRYVNDSVAYWAEVARSDN